MEIGPFVYHTAYSLRERICTTLDLFVHSLIKTVGVWHRSEVVSFWTNVTTCKPNKPDNGKSLNWSTLNSSAASQRWCWKLRMIIMTILHHSARHSKPNRCFVQRRLVNYEYLGSTHDQRNNGCQTLLPVLQRLATIAWARCFRCVAKLKGRLILHVIFYYNLPCQSFSINKPCWLTHDYSQETEGGRWRSFLELKWQSKKLPFA